MPPTPSKATTQHSILEYCSPRSSPGSVRSKSPTRPARSSTSTTKATPTPTRSRSSPTVSARSSSRRSSRGGVRKSYNENEDEEDEDEDESMEEVEEEEDESLQEDKSEEEDEDMTPATPPQRSQRSPRLSSRQKTRKDVEEDDEEEEEDSVNEDDDEEEDEAEEEVELTEEGMYPIGMVVTKEFGEGWFTGTVVAYNTVDDETFHHVLYEDNDEEDLSVGEIEGYIKAAAEKRNTAKAPAKKKRKMTAKVARKIAPKADSVKKPAAIPKGRSPLRIGKKPAAVPKGRSPLPKGRNTKRTAARLEESESDAESDIVGQDSESDDNLEEDVESESEDDEDLVEAPPPKKKQRAPPSRAGKIAAKPKAARAPPKKKRASVTSKGASDAPKPNKELYTGGDGLEVISEPQAMFDDMIGSKLTQNGENSEILIPLVKALMNRTLRVATMCSGTESPILALDMLQKSIRKHCSTHLSDEMDKLGIDVDKVFQIEHIFSCEIEPFKQAYIERNFHPPLLFRDIRELGDDKAYTAYGGLVDVPNYPGCVDMLIAGTSCVDYSNLNNRKKEMEEKGESGQTFGGMIEWIEKAQPPIVIIENVYGAPWDQKVEIFEERGYAATFLRLDTKDYYIPHTRQRGYLFAVRRSSSKKTNDDETVKCWEEDVKNLKRPASARLDEYMLPNDDPRVLRGRARLTVESCSGAGESRSGRTDWTKCETRHQKSRSEEELGNQRPLTGWSDSGNTTLPSFAWNEWANAQVHRIHDLMDINTIRMAKVGMDCTYKTMVWNLSQNVDRDTMGKLGLCQCLTPSGVPYVTNRGGPLVGEELLLLQGIPAEDLLLTKESEDNLKDLAGNAMSTTVVGACMLTALLRGLGALSRRKDDGAGNKVGVVVPSLVPPPLLPISDVSISQTLGQYEEYPVDLGPGSLDGSKAWSVLLSEATSSAKKCISEGGDEVLQPNCVVECQECGHTSSTRHAFPPRRFEEHSFVPMKDDAVRVQPSTFRKKLLGLLPMRIRICHLNVDKVSKPSCADDLLWDDWNNEVKVLTDGTVPSEFRFTHITRSRIWTAHYVSREKGRLELRVSSGGITWFLFAKAPAKKGALREVLERPVARMQVEPPTGNDSVTLLKGVWELCLPVTSSIQLSIEGKGKNDMESWRQRLGLKGEFESEYEFEELKITVVSEDTEHAKLKSAIDGMYKILPKCGGACGSLRKKTGGGTDTFFFLESDQNTLPGDDAYVFSSTCHRTAYGEYREIIVGISREVKYRPLHSGKLEAYSESVPAVVQGQWVSTDDAVIEVVNDTSTLTQPVPGSSLTVATSSQGWKLCPEIVNCTIPMDRRDELLTLCKNAGGSLEVNLQKSKRFFLDTSFVLSRISIPAVVDADGHDDWLALDSSRMQETNGEYEVCSQCAPAKPRIHWKVVLKGNRTTFVPMEDGKEAALYERALKHRPQAWVVRLRQSPNRETHDPASLNLQIGCNAVSLVQRALGILPAESLARKSVFGLDYSNNCSFEWRVIRHIDKTTATFPKLTFTSNKRDKQADQPPGFLKYNLRKEQLRSLTWMLQQESTTEPFFEEEVTEAILPSLNWRAEGRVRRPVLVRAGIVADEVGYGKTAITLGLIDSAEKINGPPPELPAEYRSGFIPTKATLVIVPGHLMGQWPQEIEKFLGEKKKKCIINSMNDFNKLSIKDVQEADIVVVNFTVLSNEKYFSRLARLSGIDASSVPSGTNGGRHFDAVYNECLTSLTSRVNNIVDDCEAAYTAIVNDASSHQKMAEKESVTLDGKKSAYKNGSTLGKKKNGTKAKAKAIESSERDPWGLSSLRVKKEFTAMHCPPLEMFFWNRLVVDEFTYLAEKSRERVLTLVTRLNSTFRWCLSGTPRHGNFNDIRRLAALLGTHLGVEESLPGAKLGRAGGKDTTGLESMSHFLEVRSMQWHERRHRIGQAFLDRFVRQNIAEIDEIRFEEHKEYVDLPPVERAIYLELETVLESLDNNIANALKSKKKSTGDRENRMQTMLQNSGSAEEALLKCCSHFNMSAESSTALKTIGDIIDFRKEQQDDLKESMVDSLAAAYRQRQRIIDEQPDWATVSKAETGEVLDALKDYEKSVERRDSVPHGADDEGHDLIDKMLNMAQLAFEDNPDEIDQMFEDVNGDDESEDAGASDLSDEEDSPRKRKRASSKKSNSSAKKKKKKTAKTAEQIRAMKVALRDHLHLVRSSSQELCGRIRSLRYIEEIRRFQKNDTDFRCSKCAKKGLKVDEVGVLSKCGHVGCLECLKTQAAEGKCINENSCSAIINSAHVVSSADFGLEHEDFSGGEYGKKLTAVVEKVKEIIGKGDRLIVFCQFDDLKAKIRAALTESDIVSLQVEGNVQRQVKALSIFQKDEPAKDDPRVLVLKMDDEQSAGLNLTNLNHAIFVHPLLASNQQEYDSHETQAIGRIRRFGQNKTVHVWRFLARETIDTKIFDERSGRPISATTANDDRDTAVE